MLYLAGGGDKEDSILLDKAFNEQLFYNFPIIAIPERSGIIVEESVIKVIGFEAVTIIERGQKKILHPNESMSI